MYEHVKKTVKDGSECWACVVCGQVLIRLEPNGIFGHSLMDLDKLVIINHYLEKHA